MLRRLATGRKSATGFATDYSSGFIFCFILTLLWASSPVFSVDTAVELESTSAELEEVQQRIGKLESAIEAARNQAGDLEKELRNTDAALEANAQRQARLQRETADVSARLAELNRQREQQQLTLADARAALARQIRAAYINGERDYLKLLLNQQDPNSLGRMLMYYDYFNRARTEEIHTVSHELASLAELARDIEKEQLSLTTLQQREQARQLELEGLRTARQQIIRHLNSQIRAQGEELAVLREDQARLENLLEELHEQQARAPTRAAISLPDFASLRGKLNWPVSGRLLNSFGSSRRGDDLSWQGVRLAAQTGEDVQAVSPGQIVFADWFRNLGLLIIVDHGGGYMSLYGHNNELLKGAGDWVEDGEIIARAGDSGGLDSPALYFEIRHQGKPVNPGLWCRR